MPKTEEKKHMCELAKKGNIKAMKKAARGARFICVCCGRSAAGKEVLCDPESLG